MIGFGTTIKKIPYVALPYLMYSNHTITLLVYYTDLESTKFLYNNSSHGQKHKIQIFERPSPSNSPEIVLHTLRHSTLIVP
jgi:hypothetical protein